MNVAQEMGAVFREESNGSIRMEAPMKGRRRFRDLAFMSGAAHGSWKYELKAEKGLLPILWERLKLARRDNAKTYLNGAP